MTRARTFQLLSCLLISVILLAGLTACAGPFDSRPATFESSGSSESVVTTGETTTSLPTTQESLTPTESTAPGSGPFTLVDYFPLTADVFCDYGGTGNEYVPMQVWVEYAGADFVQLSEDNGGTQVHKLYRVRDGQVQLVNSVAELYVREDLRWRPEAEAPEVLLQEPLEVGTTWLVRGKNRWISAVDVRTTTPAGTFYTLEVTTEGDGVMTRQYYAPGIGLVRLEITGDYEISQWLQERRAPKARTMPLQLFYGRLTQTDTEVMTRTIEVDYRTNIGLREQLQRYFREPAIPDMPPLISANTIINSLAFAPETGIVTIDFSPELVTEMNAGSTFEAVIIRCLVNTVGHAYGTDQVVITLAGLPYESGHIALGPGEYFGVNDEGILDWSDD